MQQTAVRARQFFTAYGVVQRIHHAALHLSNLRMRHSSEITRCTWACVETAHFPLVAQLVEATDSRSAQCGFESHQGDYRRARRRCTQSGRPRALDKRAENTVHQTPTTERKKKTMSELEEAARQVLHNIDPMVAGGIPAGGFVTALLNAWGRADRENSDRLAGAFPVLGAAVAEGRSGGVKALLRLIAQERGESK